MHCGLTLRLPGNLFPPLWALGGVFNSKMVRIALILISKEAMLPKPGNE